LQSAFVLWAIALLRSTTAIGTLISNTGDLTFEVSDPKVVAIKFVGNAARAECTLPQPANLWKDTYSEVWAINPFGYGGSSGQPTLQRFPEMVDAVYDCVRRQFPGFKLVVFGNSIGSLSAMRMAAKYPVDGVFIRNPVPIHQLISQRPMYAIPSLGLSSVVAMQIPRSLNTVKNAKLVNAPTLFLTCANDTLVLPRFQAKVMNAFAGEKRAFEIPGDHNDCIPDAMQKDFREAANWLLERVLS
jgi:pimeloyl-ACP methyl ester carboxylesterase